MMTYAIPPITQPFEIEINLPGSKSIALRQLAMSALTEEPTLLSGVPDCDDADAMIEAASEVVAGKLDEAAQGNPADLPAGSLLVDKAGNAAPEPHGKDVHLNATPSGNQEMPHLVNEHDYRQDQ